MSASKLQLLRLHFVSRNVAAELLEEIADASELVELEPGDVLLETGQLIENVYFIVNGRIKLSVHDAHGNEIFQRFVGRDDQIGALGAALAEPIPTRAIVHEHSRLLKIDYKKCQDFCRQSDEFRSNCATLIARGTQKALIGEKLHSRPRFIAVCHQTPATRSFTDELLKRLTELGESPCVLSDRNRVQIDNVRYRSLVENGERISDEEAWQQLEAWSDAPRIMADVQSDVVTPDVLKRFFYGSECILYCVTSSNWEAAADLIEAIEKGSPGLNEKLCIVWLLNADEDCRPNAPKLSKLASREFMVRSHPTQPRQGRIYRFGLERVVHFLRGVQIGIALGGGAARGMAHLGVLKALEQNGIIVDMIAGTSAGAMTGTVYASGMDVDYAVDRFVADLTPSWLFQRLPRGEQWFLVYKYRRGHFDPMLRKYLKDKKLEQLVIPMHAVTVDLVGGAPVVRETGDAVHSIVESINLPVLSVPINRNGQSLVDGGLVNNIPANVLVSKGCNFVIAVSVTAQLEKQFAQNTPETPTPKMKSASTLQTVLRSFLVQSTNMNSIGVEPADIVIEPDVTGFELTEFTRTDELSAIGYDCAIDSISQVKTLLRQLDKELFA